MSPEDWKRLARDNATVEAHVKSSRHKDRLIWATVTLIAWTPKYMTVACANGTRLHLPHNRVRPV